MRLLDLFSGAGGAACGYQRAGFYVVGVDIKSQPRYCGDEFIQADALEYVAEHGREYDVIHASPPCQAYSEATPMAHRGNHPDLIAPTRELLQQIGQPYVIENVEAARALLVNPVMLCGTMFGLGVQRHRYFEIWPHVFLLTPPCKHDFVPVYVTGSTGRSGCGFPRKDALIDAKRRAMGIDWMVTGEIDEAIPPAYTEWIGQQLLRISA